ncbi:MAG: DEAD/DEAH box helicase [Desulfuromusa sp.]|jgi:ATP-dependent RNA helicase RhlE|nr:DEAD/DEAH box helicase [Desulfuromusa sp.]
MNFSDFNFHQKITDGVTAAGFTQPTPIQEQAIPKIMQHRDVMGLAQTGTGKTAAFGLPILQQLMKGPRGCVRALVIAPTRELAEQIHASITLLGQKTGLRSVTVYGGVGIHPQISKLKGGAEIVVACPGRLLDHIKQSTIDLRQLDLLVLDEADRMFDMGFLPDIRRIVKCLPANRQTLLFSATMPKEIRHLAGELLTNPETVQIDTVAPAVTVSHALYPVSQHLKTDLLLKILGQTETESVLVFTRTKHRAKRLGEKLEKSGYRAASLQGNLSQSRRQAALDGFRDGRFQILVATDIAARGIDVSLVSHVINFDMPDTTDAYIHRIGRTGRAARKGKAFTMVCTDDKLMVRAIERALGAQIDRHMLDKFDYAVPAPKRAAQAVRRRVQPVSRTKSQNNRVNASAVRKKVAASR